MIDNFEFKSSRNAHRLIKFTEDNCPEILLNLIFKIYEANFTGNDISNDEVLIDISKKCGLDDKTVREFLSGKTYGVEVEVDTEEAVFNGITAVPHYIIHTANHQLIIPGAFEKKDFKTALIDLTNGEITNKTCI